MKLLYGLIVFLLSGVAQAQDAATEHTQLLNNIELITENLRQLQGIENQIEMIKNQVEELKSVATYQNNFNDVESLRGNLAGIAVQGTALSHQTQNIINQMQQELAQLPASGSRIEQQEAMDQSTLNIVQNALSRAAQLRASYQQEIDSVNSLMGKNDQAIGQTQALQTSNEIAAQNIAQMQSSQELMSEQISLQAAMMTKQLQEEKDEDEKMKQIFNAADDGSVILGTGS